MYTQEGTAMEHMRLLLLLRKTLENCWGKPEETAINHISKHSTLLA